MADVKWIKVTTDVFDDEKILLIESLPSADSIITIWFKLLALAGKQNNNGVFLMSNRIPYTDEMLATIFRREISVVRLALRTFEQFGMIEVIDNVITIPNWNKHQTLDAYEKKKERDRLYQQERREKQKRMIEQKSSDKSSDVAVSEEDKEEEREEDKEKDKNQSIYQGDAIDMIDAFTKLIKENIEYDYLLRDYPTKTDVLEELLNILVETVSVTRKSIRISNADYPYELVKGVFMKLNMGHIKYVMDSMERNTTKIRNIKSYLLTALYNAPNTIGNYYQAEVNHDMYGMQE